MEIRCWYSHCCKIFIFHRLSQYGGSMTSWLPIFIVSSQYLYKNYTNDNRYSNKEPVQADVTWLLRSFLSISSSHSSVDNRFFFSRGVTLPTSLMSPHLFRVFFFFFCCPLPAAGMNTDDNYMRDSLHSNHSQSITKSLWSNASRHATTALEKPVAALGGERSVV